MKPKDPLHFRMPTLRFKSFTEALETMQHPPFIGVTQGGSSRPNRPAKPAATKGEYRPNNFNRIRPL